MKKRIAIFISLLTLTTAYADAGFNDNSWAWYFCTYYGQRCDEVYGYHSPNYYNNTPYG